MRWLLIIFISMSSLSHADIMLRKFNNLYCYDGDTCYVTIDKTNTKIRLLELDTPEISKPKCQQELDWGIEARDFLNNSIVNAQSIKFQTNYDKDYFGRILAYLIIDDENISKVLISNKLGVIYIKNKKMDWCAVKR